MKRLLLALMLVASTAHAGRLAVVVDRITQTSAAFDVAEKAHIATRLTEFMNVMDRLGVDYDVINPKVAKTSMCATGVFTINLGMAGAYTIPYDAVVHLNFKGARSPGQRIQSGYNPDSLTRVAGYIPTVPQLFLMTGGIYGGGASISTDISDQAGGAPCTTGVDGIVADYGDGSGQSVNQEQSHYRAGTHDFIAQNSYTAWSILNPTQPAGGARALLAHGVNAGTHNGYLGGVVNSNWFDSTTVDATPDSVVMWERMMTHYAGAKPMVFAHVGGLFGCLDSTAGVDEIIIPCEGNMMVMMAALARIDSITGGEILFQKKATPFQAAITIDGGFNRSGRRHPGGINPPDTTVLWAVIDSLKTLPNLKITLGVDMDSVAYQTSEKVKWLALGSKIRFAPMTWVGLDSATAGLGNSSYQRPVDVWGRFRARAFYGDGSGAGKDTSIHAGLRALYFKADSVFGDGMVSTFALAPMDDWTPKNMLAKGGTGALDSLFRVLDLLGISGVRIDTQRPEANIHLNRLSKDLTKGWIAAQGTYREGIGGSQKNLLAHSGYSIAGGWTHNSFREDSTAPLNAACTTCGIAMTPNIITRELNRFWRQTTQKNMNRDDDLFGGPGAGTGTLGQDKLGTGNAGCVRCGVYESYEDYLYGVRHGSILKMHVQDFGGAPAVSATNKYGPPARNGWWIVKSIANSFKAINELANRNVCELVFPEDIVP